MGQYYKENIWNIHLRGSAGALFQLAPDTGLKPRP